LGNVSKEQIIFRQKFSGNDYNDIISHPTINLSEVQKSLTMKINNMLLLGGILDVVIMLDSFSRGVKD
jgi:hypothetical protein